MLNKEVAFSYKVLLVGILLVLLLMSMTATVTYNLVKSEPEVVEKVIEVKKPIKTPETLVYEQMTKVEERLKEVNVRKITDKYVARTLRRLTDIDVNRDMYYIRNEFLYWNKNMTVEEAAYKAIVIYTEAKKADNDPFLIAAQAVVESDMRQHRVNGDLVTSHAGAMGIMQLTPLVARMYDVDPAIMEENVEGGSQFIADLQAQYGKLDGALGHYNGGSRPYYKIKNYKETGDYVKKVTAIYESMVEKYR